MGRWISNNKNMADVKNHSTLPTNLVAYYSLEDVTDSKASFDLTNNVSVTFTPGKIDNAANAGVTGGRWLSIANDLGITNGNASLSCWGQVKTAPTGSETQTMIRKSDGGTFVSYTIRYQKSGANLQVLWVRERVGVADDAFTEVVTLTIDTWFHFVLTYDGTDVEAWRNGSAKGTVGSTGDGGSSVGDQFVLMSHLAGSAANIWKGLVDEAGVWSKQLADAEVAHLYNSGTGIPYEGLVTFIPQVNIY